MKLLIENWRKYLNEAQIDFDPSDADNIEQHLKLGKEHVIKYMNFLGQKATDSGDQKDIKKATVYWYSFSDDFPEIRDIWAKYMIAAANKKKENVENILAQDEENRRQLFAISDVLMKKFNLNLQKAVAANIKDNDKEAKEYMERAVRFQKLNQELGVAHKNKNWDFIKDLYNNFVRANK